jgi:hypothetical protein
MLRRTATSPWVFVSLALLTSLASAQTPARTAALSPADYVAEGSGVATPANMPDLPVADPQPSPANILQDGPRDVGTKVDPTVCTRRPLPDDVVAQCRRWLLIADAGVRSEMHGGKVVAVPNPQRPQRGPA